MFIGIYGCHGCLSVFIDSMSVEECRRVPDGVCLKN